MADSIQHDMDLRHDGRVIQLTVFVNTNENINDILQRVQRAARGQIRAAVLAAAAEYKGDAGREIWREVQNVSVSMAANPKSTIVEDKDG